MCSCSVKVGTKQDVIPGQVTGIPFVGVMKNDFFTLLSWAWCINSEKVKKAFKDQANMDISADDFPKLVKGYETGADQKGFGVNFKSIVTNIRFTNEELQKASCTTIITK